MGAALSLAEIEEAVASLPGWSFGDDRLTRTFSFRDFKAALAFIVRVGVEAELAGHHPEIFNVYSTVRVSLNTHDAGGKVTDKDVRLARTISGIEDAPA